MYISLVLPNARYIADALSKLKTKLTLSQLQQLIS